jgi:hypothetical protein
MKKVIGFVLGLTTFLIFLIPTKIIDSLTENRDIQTITGFASFAGLLLGVLVYRLVTRQKKPTSPTPLNSHQSS